MKGWGIVCAILAPLLMLVEVSMDLMQPTLMANIIDIGIANNDTNYILQTGAKMIGVALIGVLGGVSCGFFAAIAGMKLGEALREGLFDKVQSFSFLELDRFTTGSLITRLTNDVTQIQNMVMMGLKMIVRAPFMCIGAMYMAFSLSRRLSVVFAIAIPSIIVLTVVILGKAFPFFGLMQEKLDRVNTVMRESILGIRVIKAFRLEERQRERFGETNTDLMQTTVKAMNINMLLMPLVMLVMNMSVIGVLWIGGNMVAQSTLEVGRIMAFINYLLQTMMSLMMAIMIVLNFSRAKASSDRINEVLDTKTSIQNEADAVEVEGLDVEFRDVSFRYHDHGEYVLKDLSFTAKEGEMIGIIGATGAGKTSFVGLIPRLYDVKCGQVLIGGKDVKSLRLEDLRQKIGVILQESILFSGTIEENLKFGNHHADELLVREAAKAAQAETFILEKPEQYLTPVEQRGKNLSGGQKQRLSIARTLLREPKILIMDDATSALDMVTEAKLQDAIKNRMKGSTVFVIAQRISGVMEADQIIVLDEGKIVGRGTHQELLKTNEIYQSIAVSQMGEEVLLDV